MNYVINDVIGTPQHSIVFRAWVHRLIALLALPFLLVAKGEAANEHALCRDGFLQIVSPGRAEHGPMQGCREADDGGLEVRRKSDALGQLDRMETPLTLRLQCRPHEG